MEYNKEYLDRVKAAQAAGDTHKEANPLYRMRRRKPLEISSIMSVYLRSSGLSRGVNTHRIFEAWDTISGAGPFTLKKFFRSGKLYVTMSSSMIRSQLWLRRSEIILKMNALLTKDSLYTGEENPVSDIILK